MRSRHARCTWLLLCGGLDDRRRERRRWGQKWELPCGRCLLRRCLLSRWRSLRLQGLNGLCERLHLRLDLSLEGGLLCLYSLCPGWSSRGCWCAAGVCALTGGRCGWATILRGSVLRPPGLRLILLRVVGLREPPGRTPRYTCSSAHTCGWNSRELSVLLSSVHRASRERSSTWIRWMRRKSETDGRDPEKREREREREGEREREIDRERQSPVSRDSGAGPYRMRGTNDEE